MNGQVRQDAIDFTAGLPQHRAHLVQPFSIAAGQ
jgi:hypothetical protein